MDQQKSAYKHASAACNEHTALYMLDTLAGLLDQLPRVDEQLSKNAGE
jgi:transposase